MRSRTSVGPAAAQASGNDAGRRSVCGPKHMALGRARIADETGASHVTVNERRARSLGSRGARAATAAR